MHDSKSESLSTLTELAELALAVCKQQEWARDWERAGCHLHLEASEFIEALRGKNQLDVTQEAGDVLFVLLSTCVANNIDVRQVLLLAEQKWHQILETPTRLRDTKKQQGHVAKQ